MSIYDRLAARARREELVEQQTSYFSKPEAELDPRLFTANQILRPNIRTGLLSLLYGFWRSRYEDAESWSQLYLAGSGISYQWSAARDPGDLDCMVVVDWVGFRQANGDYRDLGDEELRVYLNHEMQRQLWPETSHWNGFEVTYYINEGTIASIHPYAAYSVTSNTWVVKPDPNAYHDPNPMWEDMSRQDLEVAQDIINAYNQAYEQVQGTPNPGMRLNAEITLRTAAARGALLFDSIHSGRRQAFSPGGGGFNDYNEFRYKSAKGHGIMSALREMKQELIDAGLMDQQGIYGLELPDAHDLLVATAIGQRYRG